VKKATTAKSPRAAQRKATETETEARKPKPRDDIGPNNSSEAERLRERNEELENENACLRRENLALRTEIDELKARLHTVSPPADDGLDVPEFLRRTAP
jgi:predicted RNase H-like nuclease (RuvC/YqgF family)